MTDILKRILGIHKFLHSETGKKWLAIYWPRIKEFFAKYIGYAPFTLAEKVYKTLDEVKYQGDVLDEDVIEEEIVDREEKVLSGQVELTDTGEALPLYEDMYAANKHLIFQSLEQGRIGTCATWTANNMKRLSKRRRGLQDNDEEMGITLAYRDTKAGKGDRGTVVSSAFRKYARQGLPQKSWPTSFHRNDIAEFEENKEIEAGWKYTSDFFADESWVQAKNFKHFLELEKELGPEYECQVSVDFSKAMNWWGQRKPFLDLTKSVKRTGGHSLILIRGTQSLDADGEKLVGILIDSAYRKSEKGERVLSQFLLDSGFARVRFVKTTIDAKEVNPIVIPPSTTKSDYEILSTTKIQFGNRGSNVKALQRYLKIKDDGIFGEQTRIALQKWQYQQFGGWYTGKYWWNGSIRQYKKIVSK